MKPYKLTKKDIKECDEILEGYAIYDKGTLKEFIKWHYKTLAIYAYILKGLKKMVKRMEKKKNAV